MDGTSVQERRYQVSGSENESSDGLDAGSDDGQREVFEEEVAKLQEQIQMAQQTRESLDADISRKTMQLKRSRSEREKKMATPPVYDPFAKAFEDHSTTADSAKPVPSPRKVLDQHEKPI